MKQRYISLLMALVLTLTTVLAPVPAALAGGMSALYVDGKAYEGEDLFVGWNYYKGDFDHYEYSVNDLTLDEDTAEIFRVNIGQETSINIPGELIINRHHYRVWVGACDASGNALDSSKTEFYGVSRQKDEELVLSISEAYAGQNVKISWNKIEGAERYEYTLLDLTADEYLEEREPISKCYFTLYGEDVYGAHEYKLWVGAIDGNGDVICQNIQYFTPIACSHGNTSHVESSRTCVSISDKQHSVTQVYDEMCLDCGETIATGLTETFDEKHVLDANGDCTLCDLRVSCPHTEKRYEEMINAYTDENENEHTHDIQYSEYCANPVCGKLLRLQADEKRVYTHEAHSFENDVCTKCGRIRADELKITVARDQSEAEPGDTISATATPMGGSGKHTIAWEVYCGGTLVREKTPFDNQLNMSFTPEQEGEYFFRAYLYDGEQQVYGDSAVITVKKGECQHTNVQETLGSSVYNSVSDTTHELSITWVTVCQDCGSQRSQRVETQTLAHTFVNGACTECGSLDGSGPCKHTNVVSTETGTRMYSITTLQHVIETYYRDECADCGMTIIESRVSPREEAHQIVNGSCVCGYVQPSEECDHVNQTDVLTGESYVSASATQHEVIRTYKVTCDDCSQVVNANKTTSEMAAHALDANAYCPLCGYSGQCAHSKTKDVWQYDSYAPLPDGKKHTKTEVYSRFCADPDCGQLLLAADPSLSKTKEEKHKYDDDECRFCGYVRAKAFAVTITLDQTQAAKGDTIGAQAKPIGGSGVYSFYWEAYCDGALVSSSSTAQTHFTCTASVEGSWLFRAIVRDTVNGESLAAQSGVLIVSGCDHTPTTVPTGRTTVERNWDDDWNTHIAITPSHTSCECGLININEDVRQPVKHDYTYYSGVQALHEDQGHALFERCACGVARTTGVYQPTLDGCEKCAGAMVPVAPAPPSPVPPSSAPSNSVPSNGNGISKEAQEDLAFWVQAINHDLEVVRNSQLLFSTGALLDDGTIAKFDLAKLTNEGMKEAYAIATGNLSIKYEDILVVKAISIAHMIAEQYGSVGDGWLAIEEAKELLSWIDLPDNLIDNLFEHRFKYGDSFLERTERNGKGYIRFSSDMGKYEAAKKYANEIKGAMDLLDCVEVIQSIIRNYQLYTSISGNKLKELASYLRKTGDQTLAYTAVYLEMMSSSFGALSLSALIQGVDIAQDKFLNALAKEWFWEAAKSVATNAKLSAFMIGAQIGAKVGQTFNKTFLNIDGIYSAAFTTEYCAEAANAFYPYVRVTVNQFMEDPVNTYADMYPIVELYGRLVSGCYTYCGKIHSELDAAWAKSFWNWASGSKGYEQSIRNCKSMASMMRNYFSQEYIGFVDLLASILAGEYE